MFVVPMPWRLHVKVELPLPLVSADSQHKKKTESLENVIYTNVLYHFILLVFAAHWTKAQMRG